MESLPSATMVDEELVSARAANKVVAIRFGRTADPLCQQCDAHLVRVAAALDVPAALLALYSVDIDEVPEFTYMYELYDPFTIMLFHQSRPLVLEAGHGPTRKLTDPFSVAELTLLLECAVRGALDLGKPKGSATAPQVGTSGDAADDAATWNDEASRLAHHAGAWLSTRIEPLGSRVEAAMESSGSWLQNTEARVLERGWAAWGQASTGGLAVLSSARQRMWAGTGGGGGGSGGSGGGGGGGGGGGNGSSEASSTSAP